MGRPDLLVEGSSFAAPYSSQLAKGESSSISLVHGWQRLQPRHLQNEQSVVRRWGHADE